MSVVCRPRLAASGECFSVRVGLAVAAALESELATPPLLMLKWPNDLYFQGRKLGGILCEARWQGEELAWIVAGIGINVRNRLPDEVRETAIALAEGAPGISPEALAEPVARRVAAQAGAGGPLRAAELAEFGRRDFLNGRSVRQPVSGTAAGIDRSGALLIRDAAGATRLAMAGTVVLG